MKAPRTIFSGVLAVGLCAAGGCGETVPDALAGRPPGGPYRMTLTLNPTKPVAGQPTLLHWRLTQRNDGRPVTDLQVLHERLMHNFIVARDFSSFAHIHHEDFAAVTPADREAASLQLPYRFPHGGRYRIVSEFTHRDRSWVKHFDVAVEGEPGPAPRVSQESGASGFAARLRASPSQPVAGFETELVLDLARDNQAVSNLALHLGSELHVALWREDGRYFGHTHSYTPHMAAMLAAMHDRAAEPAERAKRQAAMMIEMMRAPAELTYRGPRVPVRYVFPEPGRYHLFFECAPGGEAVVFHFALDVVTHRAGLDTSIQSIVPVQNHRHAP